MKEREALATEQGTVRSYIIGFLLSIILTFTAFFFVTEKLLAPKVLLVTIVALGTLQVLVQMLFFLHLGSESKPRQKVISFLFMVMVLVIIVGGTLWIMQNLTERTMSPMDMEHCMMKQEGFHKSNSPGTP